MADCTCTRKHSLAAEAWHDVACGRGPACPRRTQHIHAKPFAGLDGADRLTQNFICRLAELEAGDRG